MSNLCEWKVKNYTNIGNDHLLILCSMNFDMYVQEGYIIERVFLNLTVNSSVTPMIISAASICIPKNTVNGRKKNGFMVER